LFSLLAVFIGLLLVLMVFGIPISYALGMISYVVIIIASGIDKISPELIANRLYYSLNSFPILAIPLFILAGQIMNEAKLTEKIFDFVNKSIGHIRGGLGHSNVVASMIFAGMSGSATADAGGLGAVELKAMNDAGYPKKFSVGITGSSSMIGTIIPPSIPMVLYGVLANVSISKLFMGGLLPGILMGLSLMIIAYFYSFRYSFPKKQKECFSVILDSFKKAFLSLITPLIIIGGMWSGVFTPTEAGATAVAYSILLGVVIYRNINLKSLWKVFKESTKLSVQVLFILSFGAFYGYLLIRYRIPMVMAEYIMSISQNPLIFLLIINIFFLIVGCFMSTVVSITILTPIMIPIVKAFGIDPLHFGIIMVLNLTLGNLTPPFGMVLYTLSSVAKMSVNEVIESVAPFLIPLLVVLLLIIFFPKIVTFIPLYLM